MPRTLVIVESPGKTKKINSILGSDFVVRASLGHVRDLPSKARDSKGAGGRRTKSTARSGGSLSIGLDVRNGWAPTWQIVPGKEEVVQGLSQLGRSGIVYLATDLDREGEAIAWHLAELLGGDKSRFRRVTFTEITPAAIKKAFESPGSIDQPMVRAQLARRFLDRVVGFELSPLLCRRVAPGLSAGRVQSAALRLLVDRDEKIRTFMARPFYGLDANLSVPELEDPVVAQMLNTDGNVVRFEERTEVDEAFLRVSAGDIVLDDVETVEQKQNPRPPFTTSTLQQAASSRLKASVSDTMAAAQKLYEGGAITYMRSDAVVVAPEAQQAARAFLQSAFGEDIVPAKPPSYSAKAGAQEAHEAIRPTNPAVGPDETGVDGVLESRLYDLIRRRLLASQMKPARFERVTWSLTATDGDRFAARGRVVLDPGFHAVLPPDSAADDPPVFPPVEQGRSWSVAAGNATVEVSESFTKPPPRFTEASLVAQLEAEGVGRPSTYAQTLKTLTTRNYALMDGRVFVVTPLGRLVCDRLVKHFSGICDIGFTASVEASLDEIAHGRQDHLAFLDEFYGGFHADVQQAAGAATFTRPEVTMVDGAPCPSCGGQQALLFEQGEIVLACRTCPDPALLSWSPKRARRKKPKTESDGKGQEEQAAADQRLQERCPTCQGAQSRWKLSTGGYVHLCQAWPLCAGVRLDVASGSRARGRGSGGRRA